MQAAGQGVLLPERSPLQKFIVNRGLRQHLLPAVFRSGQGWKSLLGRKSSCRASLYGKRAGEGKLVGQGEPLPDKLIWKEGRGGEACWAGRAPAEQAYMERRQGWGSLLGRETWCSSTKNCSDSFLVELLIETFHQDRKNQNHSGAPAGKRSTSIKRSRIIVERLPGNAPPGS